QFIERGDDGQASDELGNEAKLQEVFRLHLVQELAHAALLLAADIGAESHALHTDAAADDFLEADECAAADEQDVGGIYLQEFLLRVLAAPFRGHARGGSFDDLQQRLLHSLARYVTSDRRVVPLARDLIDLVNVDDTALRLFDVVIGVLQQ